jgi:DNA helicase HerA-like ATPase
MMLVGLPGMGKTTALVGAARQLHEQGVTPIVFSYHPDIDDHLRRELGDVDVRKVDNLGFDPMRVEGATAGRYGHIDNAGQLRDIFRAIYPDLGDLQLEAIRAAARDAYTELGWVGGGRSDGLPTPPFQRVYDLLVEKANEDRSLRGLLSRMQELHDYGVFATTAEDVSPLDSAIPVVIALHSTDSDGVQRAYSSLVLHSMYKHMFRRGEQNRITHVLMIDEAHRASRLGLLATMAKECRKFGIAMVLASQEARDFDISLYSAIGNYMALRVVDTDAKAITRNVSDSRTERQVSDRIKSLAKFEALFFASESARPVHVLLAAPHNA